MPSNSYTSRVERALNQLDNIERTLSSAPKSVYKEKKDFIEDMREKITKMKAQIARELSHSI
jgi:hypothetical protein